MSSDEISHSKVVVFKATPKHRIREPFVPMTGNPEGGDYLDYYRCWKEGTVLKFDLVKRDTTL